MQTQALDVAREAMDKYSIEKDIAQAIKKEFDSRFGATWHCIVGRNFGSFVTHGMSCFTFPSVGGWCIASRGRLRMREILELGR